MFTHSYHFRLMRYLVRKKVKGDHRIPLTCADRVELVEEEKLLVSKDLILKVLTESDNPNLNHRQFALNEVVRLIDYKDWNDFLRKNPLPEAFYCKKRGRKPKNMILDAVEQRLKELTETL
jgi:hypothetical protein